MGSDVKCISLCGSQFRSLKASGYKYTRVGVG